MSGKPRQKRRSKHDSNGRDFKCQYWDNSYLSYPAMYTHMKTKHFISNPSGDPSMLMTTGRGRGRPKKNFGKITKFNPESNDYFKTMDKCGGPTDPLHGFEEQIVEVLKIMGRSDVDFSTYPLYEALSKFSYEATPGNPDLFGDRRALAKDPAIEQEYSKMGEEERNNVSCDDILAVYLRETSQKVNDVFYKLLLRYVICYREFANKTGWEKKKQSELKSSPYDNESTKDDEDKENFDKKSTTESASTYDIKGDTKEDNSNSMLEYWAINNAEHIPEMWNEFITVFLDEFNFGIERADAIDMTRNFCNWLYVNGHTCSKLSMA